ncbi:MAG TPA: hypothetical protein VKA37_09795 [Halobacteriales archaeon]|nr:hypothetical protein [Halobacteriales archaeon]
MGGIDATTAGSWFDWTDAEWRLWRRWVFANGAGEVVGLGMVGLVGVALATATRLEADGFGSVAVAATLVTLGTFEGAVVGYAQWRAMQRAFPAIGTHRWVGATAVGAFVAWTVGMLPSTIGDGGAPVGPTNEPSLGVVLLLAAGLGIVAGVLLSGVQWLVLREHAIAAWRWLPANAVAWVVGMPVIFLGVSLVPDGPIGAVAVVVVLATAGVAGLVVGAIHGVALVELAH